MWNAHWGSLDGWCIRLRFYIFLQFRFKNEEAGGKADKKIQYKHSF